MGIGSRLDPGADPGVQPPVQKENKLKHLKASWAKVEKDDRGGQGKIFKCWCGAAMWDGCRVLVGDGVGSRGSDWMMMWWWWCWGVGLAAHTSIRVLGFRFRLSG